MRIEPQQLTNIAEVNDAISAAKNGHFYQISRQYVLKDTDTNVFYKVSLNIFQRIGLIIISLFGTDKNQYFSRLSYFKGRHIEVLSPEKAGLPVSPSQVSPTHASSENPKPLPHIATSFASPQMSSLSETKVTPLPTPANPLCDRWNVCKDALTMIASAIGISEENKKTFLDEVFGNVHPGGATIRTPQGVFFSPHELWVAICSGTYKGSVAEKLRSAPLSFVTLEKNVCIPTDSYSALSAHATAERLEGDMQPHLVMVEATASNPHIFLFRRDKSLLWHQEFPATSKISQKTSEMLTDFIESNTDPERTLQTSMRDVILYARNYEYAWNDDASKVVQPIVDVFQEWQAKRIGDGLPPFDEIPTDKKWKNIFENTLPENLSKELGKLEGQALADVMFGFISWKANKEHRAKEPKAPAAKPQPVEKPIPVATPVKPTGPQPGAAEHYYCKGGHERPKLKPEQLTLGAQNQREAGYPNGCTQFACTFLTLDPSLDCTPDMISNLILNGNKMDIVRGVNEMPIGWIKKHPATGLKAVNPEDPSKEIDIEEVGALPRGLPEGLDLQEFNMVDLPTELNRLFAAKQLCGFVFTTGTESLAIRFRKDSIEIFDSHGDPEQRSPACVMRFSNNAAGKQAVREFLEWRCLEALIGDFPQATFTPIARTKPAVDYFAPPRP